MIYWDETLWLVSDGSTRQLTDINAAVRAALYAELKQEMILWERFKLMRGSLESLRVT